MKTGVFFVVPICALTACANPLDRIDKLSDVDLAQTDPVRGALASPEEIAREEPVLTGLLNETAATATPVAEPRGGLFARLRRARAPEAVIEISAPNPLQISTEGGNVTGPTIPVAIDAALPVSNSDDVENGVDGALVQAAVVETAPVDTAKSSVRRGGLFAGLRRARQPAPKPEFQPEIISATETEAPQEVAVEDDIRVAALTPTAVVPEPAPRKRGGFLSGLRRAKPADVPAEVEQVEATITKEVAVPLDAETTLEDAAPVAAAKPAKRQGGLFSRLRNRAPEEAVKPEVEDVQTASLDGVEPVAEPALDAAKPTKKRGGLFARSATKPRKEKKRIGPDAEDVPFGTILPYGTVARVCEAKSKDLGSKTEKAGAGRGYVLYDSVPGATGPRTFYVTGFDDGCPRQFTAALALFGAPSLHEQLRYGRPSDKYPYSTTDKAYELVKSSICLVGKRKPCGPKIDTLERDTVFISTYERFTDNGRWADILIHSGRVLASAIKDL